MSVIKIKKTENFVILHKGGLEDPRLSFKAKGLWAYCLSKPNDWVFHVTHLATISKDGEDAIYSAINELIDAGYVLRVQPNVKGKFQKMDYEFYEIPQIKEILPQPDFPYAGLSLTEKQALLSIDPKLSIEREKIVCPTPPVASSGTPKVVKKFGTDGKEESLELDEVFRRAVSSRKDWKTTEITEAWQILCSYEGRVNDLWRFIEGTIENLRSKAKLEKLKNKSNEETKCHYNMGQAGRMPTQEEIDMLKQHSPLRDFMQKIKSGFSNGCETPKTS